MTFVAANELSDLGQNYLHFESAFTYASLGVLNLALEGWSIHASDEFRRGTRYDAYDRLRQTRMPDTVLDRVDTVISALGPTVRFKNQWREAGCRITSGACVDVMPDGNAAFFAGSG